MLNKKISHVKIYLEDIVPDYMKGIMRCGAVLSYDENHSETDHQELIDNTEFHTVEALINYVSNKLNVSKDIVEINE